MEGNENQSNGKILNVYLNNVKNDHIQYLPLKSEMQFPGDCNIWVAGFASLILNGYSPKLRSIWYSFVLFSRQ